MDLNAVAIYCRVVQEGSFTKAALFLDMPKSTVSAKVAQLEAELGVTLLRRTTRQLHLTEAGSRYYEGCSQALSDLKEAERGAVHDTQEPQGTLRVTAPVEIGTGALAAGFTSFLRKYPKVELDLLLTDRVIDLIGDNVDIAIRAGKLADSRLVAKKLGTSSFHLYASPAYLAGQPPPRSPKDLAAHACLHFTSLPGGRTWTLTKNERQVDVQTNGPFSANNLVAIKTLAVAGLGIGLLNNFMCIGELASGALVPVLADWTSRRSPVHVVYPTQRFMPPKVRAFIELAVESLKATF